MSGNIVQINASTPFLIGVQNSQVSPPWIRLLTAIINTLGPQNAIVADDFETLVFTSREPVSNAAVLDEIRMMQSSLDSARQVNRDLAGRVAELETIVKTARQSSAQSILVRDDLSTNRQSSSAQSILVQDDLATNATMYPAYFNGFAASRSIKTASTKWTFNPSTGAMKATEVGILGGSAANVADGMYGVPGTSLSFAVNSLAAASCTLAGLAVVNGFGCNGATAQAAYASGGAAPAGGVGTAAGGWDTAAHRDAAITLINNMRLALVANGTMS